MKGLKHGLQAMLCVLVGGIAAEAQSLDLLFNPGSGINAVASVMVPQSDGRIIIAGDFSHYNRIMRRRLARIQADGTLDTTFDPMEGPDGRVLWVFPRSDGKIVIGGDFFSYNSIPRRYLTRLRADGSVDLPFPANDIDGNLTAAAVQEDGKILIVGSFTHINGTNKAGFARFNPEGTLDLLFSVPGGVVSGVRGLTVLASGKTLVFGSFSAVGGANVRLLARLNQNGSLDTNFTLPFVNGNEISGAVEQPDGKILVWGEFTSIDGYSRIRAARLESDGALDLGFYTPNGFNGSLSAATITLVGKAFIGGNFYGAGGTAQNYLARLNTDGSVDSSFNARLNDAVATMRVQPDGHLLVSGGFTTVNGTNINRIAQLSGVPLNQPGQSLLSARLYPAVFVEGITGTTYRIEYVNNLTNAAMWTPLTNLNLPTTPYLLLDTTWTNSRQRFYRALSLP